MDRIQVRGGRRLNGEIRVSGAKNAALPLMVASLLSDEPLTLVNVPHLTDISQLAEILAGLGVEMTMSGNGHAEAELGRALTMHARNITSTVAPYELVRKMRASFLVAGPLIARKECRHARIQPGPGARQTPDPPRDGISWTMSVVGLRADDERPTCPS